MPLYNENNCLLHSMLKQLTISHRLNTFAWIYSIDCTAVWTLIASAIATLPILTVRLTPKKSCEHESSLHSEPSKCKYFVFREESLLQSARPEFLSHFNDIFVFN